MRSTRKQSQARMRAWVNYQPTTEYCAERAAVTAPGEFRHVLKIVCAQFVEKGSRYFLRTKFISFALFGA